MRRIALLVALLAACGESAPPSAPHESSNGASVVTLLDYFVLGEERVARELANAAGVPGRITREGAAEAARAVVRLRIHFGFREGHFSTTHATAALVDGGAHALTVAHAASVAFEHSDSRLELVLDDGRVLEARARPLDHYDPYEPSTDWAVLDVVEPPRGLPALELGRAEPGERIVLGFPGRVGMGRSGRALLDDPHEQQPLRPLRVLCRASSLEPDQLELVAGAVPIGGMSGAPCVDANGLVVGIQRAVTESKGGGELRWTLEIVPLDGVRALLAR